MAADPEVLQLKKAVERCQGKLSALAEATRAINSSLELDVVLGRVLLLAHRVVNLAGAALYLEDEGGKWLAVKARVGDEERGLTPPKVALRGRSLAARALREGRLLAECRGTGRKRSCLLAVPLSSDGQTIGVLVTDHGAEEASPEDQELIRLFAGQAAVAIRNAQRYEVTLQMATLDSMTGLYNRNYFQSVYQAERERARRFGRFLSVLIVDVNNLKDINDRFGHTEGDRLIQAAARLLKGHTRAVDYVFRYGGDEFLVLLPETGPSGAESLVARIRAAVDKWNASRHPANPPLSLSIGSASASDEGGMRDLVERADRAMYRDKEHQSRTQRRSTR